MARLKLTECIGLTEDDAFKYITWWGLREFETKTCHYSTFFVSKKQANKLKDTLKPGQVLLVYNDDPLIPRERSKIIDFHVSECK